MSQGHAIPLPEEPKAVRLDEDGTFLYVGTAEAGTAGSVAAWRIKRVDQSASPDLIIQWADGDTEFDNIWDNRLGLNYL